MATCYLSLSFIPLSNLSSCPASFCCHHRRSNPHSLTSRLRRRSDFCDVFPHPHPSDLQDFRHLTRWLRVLLGEWDQTPLPRSPQPGSALTGPLPSTRSVPLPPAPAGPGSQDFTSLSACSALPCLFFEILPLLKMPTSTPASSVGNGDERRCPWACALGPCGCVPMEGMGAGGRGSERVHPRQNRGERMEFSLFGNSRNRAWW